MVRMVKIEAFDNRHFMHQTVIEFVTLNTLIALLLAYNYCMLL